MQRYLVERWSPRFPKFLTLRALGMTEPTVGIRSRDGTAMLHRIVHKSCFVQKNIITYVTSEKAFDMHFASDLKWQSAQMTSCVQVALLKDQDDQAALVRNIALEMLFIIVIHVYHWYILIIPSPTQLQQRRKHQENPRDSLRKEIRVGW